MGLKYIKTDKNGTEIYHDYVCPRCGGLGYIQHFGHVDGGRCFACSGSGRRDRPKTIKKYTEEYAKKLAEKEKARTIKKLSENVDSINERIKRNLGFFSTEELYIYVGKTIAVKDTFKSNGGRFTYLSGETPVWILKEDLGDFDGVFKKRVTLDDIPKVEGELGVGQYQDIYDLGAIGCVYDWLNQTYWKKRYEKMKKEVESYQEKTKKEKTKKEQSLNAQ